MAERLARAGLPLSVFDLDAKRVALLVEAGANAAASMAEIIDQCEVVLFSLPSPKIVIDSARMLAGRGNVRCVIDLSTTGLAATGEVAAILAGKGIGFVDAPVSGGIAGARAGTLSLMVAGDAAVLAAVEPILANLGRVFVVGPTPGAGQMMKLVNNLLNACSIAITSEGMALGIKAGLDPAVMIDVLNASTGRNSATQDKWPKSVLPRTFDFGFAAKLCLKDVKLCIDEAERLSAPVLIGGLVREALERTVARFGDCDVTAVAMLAEADAGLEF